eukprot:scaffold197678_cov17-Prasinocladus_malaysianus.AAC.1
MRAPGAKKAKTSCLHGAALSRVTSGLPLWLLQLGYKWAAVPVTYQSMLYSRLPLFDVLANLYCQRA